MDVSQLKRNFKEHNEGTWIETVAGMPGVKLKVKGWNCPELTALRSKLERDATSDQRQDDGSLTDDVKFLMVRETVACALVDWSGLTMGEDSKGKPKELPYSDDAAREMIFDPDFVPFADGVTMASTLADSKRMTKEAKVTKNSKPS